MPHTSHPLPLLFLILEGDLCECEVSEDFYKFKIFNINSISLKGYYLEKGTLLFFSSNGQ